MPHCDPAPPHPDPGMYYQAVCLPNTSLATVLVIAGVMFVAVVIIQKRRENER